MSTSAGEFGSEIPLETPSPWPVPNLPQNDHQKSIHNDHWAYRKRIIGLFQDSYNRYLIKRSERMSCCGDTACFYVDPKTGKAKRDLWRCYDRFCPKCAKLRQAKIADEVEAYMMEMRYPVHIILSVVSTDDPLHQRHRHFRQAFKKMRKDPEWTSRICGGIYSMEDTYNLDTEQYHPHGHIMADAFYMPKKLLQSLWKRYSKDSDIVWIKAVKDLHDGAREMAEYLGTPVEGRSWPGRVLVDYAQETKGERMIQTFGNVHGRKVKKPITADEPGEPPERISISRLAWLAALNIDEAIRCLLLIALRWPGERRYIQTKLPQLEIPVSPIDVAHVVGVEGQPRGPPKVVAAQRWAEIEKLEPELAHRLGVLLEHQAQGDYVTAESDAQIRGQVA